MTDDFTRRTLLANERTYLAWWRTGLAVLTVALASARVVPELADSDSRWAYTLVGAAFAVLGLACIGYAERRQRAVARAVRAGRFADPAPLALTAFTTAGVVLGSALLVIILAEA